jgi:hypothetical protein
MVFASGPSNNGLQQTAASLLQLKPERSALTSIVPAQT